MHRLTERLGYKHVRDLLADMPNGTELTGWFAYLSVDDEVQAQRTAYAFAKVLYGDKKQHANNSKQIVESQEEEIIDTTDPEFVKRFQGFTYGDKPQRPRVPQSTEIKIG